MREPANRRIVLAARPQGLPTLQDFDMVTAPVTPPGPGEVLLRTLYLSLDPYMRNLMDPVGPGYAPPVAIGATMVGGTVSRVVASRHPGFAEGDLVLANAGWQDHALSDGSDLVPLGDLAQPSLALGGLGMPGFTAHVGLLDIGAPLPGETVVVAAATGAVGSVVGQVAKIRGARVVGIAGGSGKCRVAVEELGFDACVDHRDAHFAERLAAACPQGIDVYFENVGGAVLDAVLPHLNVGARVPVCGFIAHYNDTAPQGPDRRPELLAAVLQKRIRMQGFIILDHYGPRFDAFRREMGEWVAAGRVKLREDRVEGLEQAPSAFIGLLQGRNAGKLVVRVHAD
ncbi:NADP-dependent oxidoreductase [Ramlibacter pallidus]|uniref:NADP-dependent oxidoreductase n=1 Tax=Ramlibacter pallidus TaxID=2780087 RepID=A0ABR9S7N3_9BURK|nr:NADP-dependent oxidoreductase [Ramlibacter pallidus]MBE7369546.1 NADP-dependent oxidoreductase [Ramlibacter pallidus]